MCKLVSLTTGFGFICKTTLNPDPPLLPQRAQLGAYADITGIVRTCNTVTQHLHLALLGAEELPRFCSRIPRVLVLVDRAVGRIGGHPVAVATAPQKLRRHRWVRILQHAGLVKHPGLAVLLFWMKKEEKESEKEKKESKTEEKEKKEEKKAKKKKEKKEKKEKQEKKELEELEE